ncbi:MAG TPA: RsmG family class I SAM-dependent methyltransferase [Rhodothermales bacterium]
MSVSPHLPAIDLFQQLGPHQRDRLDAYAGMLRSMNRKLNLVSRESELDISRIHIPHALSLAIRPFPVGAVIVDWGTGGGLPAIPLAICLPNVQIHAVDAIEKKIFAVRSMARRLDLPNLEAWAGDAMHWPGSATHSVSRATAPLAVLWKWHRRVATASSETPGAWRGGLLCLKGGDLSDEIAELHASIEPGLERMEIEIVPLQPLYSSPYFETKMIVHVHQAGG